MKNCFNISQKPYLNYWVNALVIALLAVSTLDIFNKVFFVFLLLSLIAFWQKIPALSTLEKGRKVTFYLLITTVFWSVFIWILNNLMVDGWLSKPAKELSELSLLLFIPLFVRLFDGACLSRYALWLGCILGAMICGIVTIYLALNTPWDDFVHNNYRGRLHHIHFGSFSLVLTWGGLVFLGWQRALYPHLTKLAWLAVVLGIIGTLGSHARAPWLAIPSLILLAVFAVQGSYWKKLSILMAPVMALTAMFFIPQTGVQSRVNDAVDEIQLYATGEKIASSTGLRFEMWRVAAQSIEKRPILGHGFSTFSKALDVAVSQELVHPMAGHHKSPHNLYLFIWFTSGLFGLLLFSSLLMSFMYFFYLSWSIPSNRAVALFGLGVVSIYMHIALVDDWIRNSMCSFFVLFIAVSMSLVRYKSSTEPNKI